MRLIFSILEIFSTKLFLKIVFKTNGNQTHFSCKSSPSSCLAEYFLSPVWGKFISILHPISCILILLRAFQCNCHAKQESSTPNFKHKTSLSLCETLSSEFGLRSHGPCDGFLGPCWPSFHLEYSFLSTLRDVSYSLWVLETQFSNHLCPKIL